MPKNKKALATLAIGDSFLTAFNEVFRPSWELYADRHGYDILVFDDYIDRSDWSLARKPHWQKHLVIGTPEAAEYESVAVIDGDIHINPINAPCIVSSMNTERIGIVGFSQSNRETARMRDRREPRINAIMMDRNVPQAVTPDVMSEYYTRAGYTENPPDEWSNGGVLVLRPGDETQRDIMRRIYHDHDAFTGSYTDGLAICQEVFGSGYFEMLDPRFNAEVIFELAEIAPYLFLDEFEDDLYGRGLAALTIWLNNWFLHFIGGLRHLRQDAVFITKIGVGADGPEDAYRRFRHWAQTRMPIS